MVSVIIPIYNVEKYLDRCLESIVNQTQKDLEIILVNDGSTDDCAKMCNEWAKKDDRIKVIHKENGGLSDARNAGINFASGEYIMFLDSDDYYHENMCKIMHETIIKRGVDLVCCDFIDVNEEGDLIKRPKIYYEDIDYKRVYDGREFIKFLLENKAPPFAWNKIYKRNIFFEKRFKKGYLAEDYEFLLRAIRETREVYFISDKLYYYTYRDSSITSGFNKKFNLDVVKNIYELEDFLIDRFGDDIKPSLKTAELESIRLYLTNVPYKHMKNEDNSYLYVSAKLKVIKWNIFKGKNGLKVKLILLAFLVSRKFAKIILITINKLFGK